MISEDILELPRPVDFMCPKIDSFIKLAKNHESIVKDLSKAEDMSDVTHLVNDLEWDISDVEGNFEECRTACESIREWGEDWKNLAKVLLDEHYPEWRDGDSEDHNKVWRLFK